MAMQGGTASAGESWRPRPPLTRAGVARLVQAAGLFTILTWLLPPRRGGLEALVEYLPMTGILTARAATAVSGMLLIYLGAGLRRGKRSAWRLAVFLAGAGVILHIVKGLDFDAAAVSGALLAALIAAHGRFRAVADPRNPWRALAAFAGFAGAGFTLGMLEIALRPNRLIGAPGVRLWAEHVALGLVGAPGPLRFRHPLGAEAVSLTTGAFGLLALGATTVLLLRHVRRDTEPTAEQEHRLRELLRRYGAADSLGYFALRRDKLLMWAPSGKAAVPYRVINGVSLATGDPIGDHDAWPQAIDAWLADSARYGWTPAVLGCGPSGGRSYRRSGLDVVELGDEAVVDVAGFSLEGRPMRAVRQAIARAKRAGYSCEVARQRDLPPAALAEAVRAARQFRDGPVERGFSMALSRIGDPQDDNCVLVLCRDGSARLRGVLQFVPWGDDGLSLDLMRGDRSAVNGVMELMVVSAIEAAPSLDVRRLSLNFAVLRSVFARAEGLGAGPVLRIWHRLLRLASRFWQIESLYRANAKYQPMWQPRYLCFPTARDLPRITVAVLKAEAFLPTGWRPARRTDGAASAPSLEPAGAG
ncbi:phosphatidylglycerol lysyltransferase domain-containing protein [Micromonospora sp. SL1-18]|uniref:phosphatidylglycerol lysyltransferase domain-containing protein n=1 Tax=Micromonospora sp. SL1-18 TaxID=3399128 RepID=UPI003A4DAA38